MKKLALDTDTLRVESFPTANISTERGTVEANAATQIKTCAATCHCTSVNIGCWCTEQC